MSFRSTFNRRTFTLTVICLLCTLAISLLYVRVPAYQTVELLARDWLATNPMARLSPRHPDLMYLGIDEASKNLDTLFDDDLAKSPTLRLMKAGWPWNRAVYAAVLDRLVGAGAKAVVFDVIMPAPRAGDAAFKAALDQFADRVALGSNLETKSEDAGDGSGPVGKKPSHVLPSASLIPREIANDSRVGFVNVYPDFDGKVRRVHFRTTLLEFFDIAPVRGAAELYSLSARALQKAGFEGRIPQTHEPTMVRFAQEIRPRSLYEIFDEDMWNDPHYRQGALFKDKIVLIGAAGNVAEDRLQTPFGAALGPTIHLSAINAALNRDFLHETSLAGNVALIAGAGLLAWLLGVGVRKPMLRLLVLLAALAGYFGAVQLLFNAVGFFPVLLSPLLALGFSGLTWSVWEQVLDLRDKARLRRTFERYVSRDVVKELLDNPASYLNSLGGQRKQVTVLFSDVRGFTSITENGDAQALVAQLNEYFNEMVNIVFRHRGTLDKFIGDAVMAQWGGIVSEGEKNDALNAVAVGVEMRKALARMNTDWARRGMLELKFGIGINKGEAIVGNLGCEAKMEVSLIGDAVNTASRLEGMTKQFHVDLLIGETVAPLVRDRFLLRSVALSQPKGKTVPLEIFMVIDERTPELHDPAWLETYEEGVRLFRTREFTAAAEHFEAVARELPEDWLAAHYLAESRTFAVHPPPPEWSAVDVMISK